MTLEDDLILQKVGPELRFGCPDDGWGGFDVVRFHAQEAISEPYDIGIDLLRSAENGIADIDALVGSPATLAFRTEHRWRRIHGILAEIEELDRTKAVSTYHVRLVPHLWRAKHRVRCRTFVGSTLEEIVTTVLENRAYVLASPSAGLVRKHGPTHLPPTLPEFEVFVHPTGSYRLALSDTSRFRDTKLRDYVVQYNESDYAFLERLLEEEGLSYYFDHEETATVLTITDKPGWVPLFSRDVSVPVRSLASGGGPRDQEVVRRLRRARRMHARSVSLQNYDELRPRRDLEVRAEEAGADAALEGRREFPGRDDKYDGATTSAPPQVRLEREIAESSLAEGWGNVRTLEPGLRVKLVGEAGVRDDLDCVVIAVETYATGMKPEGVEVDGPFGPNGSQDVGHYEVRFTALDAALTFRPGMKTPRPHVQGVHAAVVTADEAVGAVPEIHCNEDGWVRVRFPWDQRQEPGTASSTWVRPSQGWAGAGFGSNFVPRVGHEVLVAYYQGDVERPVIVGRVHNPTQPMPYPMPEKNTVSTIKSCSSPGGEGFNEFRFEDKKGAEEIYLHAQRSLNELVLGSHSCSVGGDQSYGVGHNQVNSIGGDRRVYVTGDQVMSQNSFNSAATNDHSFSSQTAVFSQSDSFKVEAPLQEIKGSTLNVEESATILFRAGAASIIMTSGVIMIDNGAGASITLGGAKVAVRGNGGATLMGGPVDVKGGRVVVKGDTVNLNAEGSNLGMHAAGTIDARASLIKLNG